MLESTKNGRLELPSANKPSSTRPITEPPSLPVGQVSVAASTAAVRSAAEEQGAAANNPSEFGRSHIFREVREIRRFVLNVPIHVGRRAWQFMAMDPCNLDAPIFDGVLARRGYALNKMCYSLNHAENRAAFLQDETAYCARFGLTPVQTAAVEARNVLHMLMAGGNIYYLAKLAGVFGLNVQDIGAQQTGMSVQEFKTKLASAGE